MTGFAMCIPFVAAIIERNHNGIKQVLIQTRQNLKQGGIYNGTLEFAAGTLDRPYENVYDALKREIKEETGLDFKKIIDDSQTPVLSPQEKDAVFGFRPFCCTQQLRKGRPWVGFVFRAEVHDGEPIAQEGETEDVHWMDLKDFYKIFKNEPQKIFTLELPAWHYYFQQFPIGSS